jgi:membrane-associated phospholipid phosphatase
MAAAWFPAVAGAGPPQEGLARPAAPGPRSADASGRAGLAEPGPLVLVPHPVSNDAPSLVGDGRRTAGRFAANLGRGTVGLFRSESALPLLIGSAATAGAFLLDDDVRRAVADPDDRFSRALDTGAGPIASSVFVAAMFAAGRLSHAPRFRAMTYDMAQATIINLAFTEVLKVVVRRERPNGENRKSFPSGHASSAFALAAVAARHYGWKAGAPAYVFAAMVAGSRVRLDKHYLSDVVAGATLGYIVGRAVERVNSQPLPGEADRRGRSVAFSLQVGHGTRGVRIVVVFK